MSLASREVRACPGAYHLLDKNCDGRVTAAFVGDSFVSGVGDRGFPSEPGYVGALGDAMPRLKIQRFGTPGITSFRLLRTIRRAQEGNRSALRKISSADYVFIDVGRNDFFLNRPARRTARVVALIATELQRLSAHGGRPSAVVSVIPLLATRRVAQNLFLQEINAAFRRRAGAAYETGPELGEFPLQFLEADGLHPNHLGYLEIAKQIRNFLISGR